MIIICCIHFNTLFLSQIKRKTMVRTATHHHHFPNEERGGL